MTTGVTTSKPSKPRSLSGNEIKQDIGLGDSKEDIASNFKNSSGPSVSFKQLDKGRIVQPNAPNVHNRKATLYTQAPWKRRILDVSAQSETAESIKFRPPEKPFVEANSGWIKTFTASGGALIGGIVGSAVPIIGTAIGVAAGAVAGRLVGHLIKKYGRSHSDRRRFQKAVAALQKQGVKFTKREKKRLENMRPDQWKHLNKRRSEIVNHLARCSKVRSDPQRWAKELFNQYAVLNVAKYGYIHTQVEISDFNAKAAKFQALGAVGTGGLSPDAMAQEMLENIDGLGGDGFAITRQAKSKRRARRKVDARQAAAKQKWRQLKSEFARAFGEDQVKRFEDKYARYIELGTRYSSAETRFKNAKYLAVQFGKFIEPQLAQYDDKIRDRLSRLANKYAVDVALGDLNWTSVLDKHHNFQRERIAEFINKAERLQRAKDRENGSKGKPRVPPDTLIRQATLPNRLSDYAEISSGDPGDLYDRFVSGAVDLYEECEALLDLPKASVDAALEKDILEPDPLAEINTKNLIELAELGKDLKDKAVDSDTARMLLRLEATERGVKAEMDQRNKDVQNADQDQRNRGIQATLAPGWSAQLANAPEEAVPETLSWSARIVSLDGAAPRQDVIDIARQAAADAKTLHETLQSVPSLSGLTLRDAETTIFSLVSKTQRYAVNDCDVWKTLTANNFADLITILKSGVDAGKTYENLLKGQNLLKDGLSVNDAIECTRLNVSADRVAHIRNSPDQTEYAVWRGKGFTDIEIAAYRESLVIWENEDTSNPLNPLFPQRRDDSGRRLGLNDGKMDFFKGSGLTRSEANQLLWLDLVPESKVDPSPIELRHRSESKVLSEKIVGTGCHHVPIKREVRNTDGTIDTRVFKELPKFEGNLRPLRTKGLVGSNLGASMINEALEFNAIVHTQLSVRKSRIGVSMELAKGYTADNLINGKVFLEVPRNESHYDELNKAVEADLDEYGAISEATRKLALEKYGFTRLRMVGRELQAAGNFMKDLIHDAGFQRMVAELQIIDFLTDELDRNLMNFLIDVRLGPKGAMAIAVKGIDNDCGFANRLYMPWSIRTTPRVMSRQQADAIKKMYKDPNGILSGLGQVVAPSTLYVPVKSDRAFQFQNSRALTAANLKPDRTGNQVALFKKRLDLLHQHIVDAEGGDSPMHADGAPVLTIIDDDEPNKEIKVDLDNNVKDGGAGWGGDEVTKILKNTSSIVATCDAARP